MQLKRSRVFDAGRRVQGFLDSEGPALGATVPETLRTQLDAAIARIAAFQLEEETLVGTPQGETANQEAMRKALYADFLQPIAGVARFALRNTPDLTTLVVSPNDLRNDEFLTKVNAVADCAATHEQLFLQHGLSADFIAQLRAAVTQIAASRDSRALRIGRLAAARAGIEEWTSELRKVLGVLNRVLTPILRKNPPLLANWVASKRVRATAVTPLPTGDAGSVTGMPSPASPAAESPKP